MQESTSKLPLIRIAQSVVNAMHAIMMFMRPDELEGSPAYQEGYAGRETSPYREGSQQHADWETGCVDAITDRAW